MRDAEAGRENKPDGEPDAYVKESVTFIGQ